MKENIKKIDYWIYIVISSILFIIITKLLISISFPHITEKNRELYEIMLSVYQSRSIGSLHIAMCAPISEEITYRLFWSCILLYTLNKYKWKWVITGLITSLLWSFGHGGGIEPECMRFAQIFIYGIILSALFRKKGIEACIISHMISNIFITFIWK